MKKLFCFFVAAIIVVLVCSVSAFAERAASREVLEIEGELPSEGIIRRHYSGKLTTHKGNTYWYVKDGKLPTGLRNIYDDIITTDTFYLMGFPSETGVFTFTVEAHHLSNGETQIATRTFTITIKSTSDETTTPDVTTTPDNQTISDNTTTPDNTTTQDTNTVESSGGGGGGGGCNAGLGVIALLALAFRRSR